ncbi:MULTISPECIES: DUF397 domain-containing protein [Dactylosporangium]|uniref:DUF397 domain-containing protein n=2 Tax=Dactylosporangium TaxID=35753 RepID=A0A9W6NQK0_9ACTN|nr:MULTISPECIES: DUF397 domain-containing protein [Dactylosporangium]UAB94372.1 DUF397 domain-containing protein [Dactylosporangium vinaceum]UWZ42771.1 DUF397 domain-containing protein [Dactylosporangium matsuzakiense]GLL05428.1 hypothetical protein GCM10017581_071750 [Dactylosporangium matsuzakiense]
MATHFQNAAWRKSSRSNGNGGANCVEVAVVSREIGVRDSKNPTGPVLTFTAVDWASFVDGTKLGSFDSAH